ncbi:hypothetical protein CAPN004_02400 [Capnocytophaga cynodegmi]|uniref:hypothetical protein n=1 Tax=Capnocytophaga cynodegmi TaxID=28189 RepID=UPI001AD009E9|nr:hypothetical protein [Capnocytophaga cynodegmi]GIM51210.1 hypothetical protein CAPN004_02400 [Capnocytophaga cynodegmi]
MSEDKLIRFQIFRYHLLPIESKYYQTNMFQDKPMSYKEIRERKNDFFNEALFRMIEQNNSSNPLKLEIFEDNYFVFKVAQKKKTTITKNFENRQEDTEPYCFVIINNNPNIQKIAISYNSDAFSEPSTVKNILLKKLVKYLTSLGLNIEIKPLYNEVKFWEIIRKYEKEITRINFNFVKPNLAQISKSLPEAFKDFVNETNSHESNIIIKAPKKGVLENITPQNSDVQGLVQYTSEGAGSIKVKVKGYRKVIKTKQVPVTKEIRELEIEGSAEQVIKLYKDIVD